jgi:predicted transposase/invertase (TIGR01784 family)
LLDFLNELLKDKEGTILEISYLPNEKLPITIGDRRAIFDLYCKNEKGEYFIVEMQKAEQQYFKDRTLFYSTFPIQEQARNQGKNWDFKLKNVYTIGILDFEFEEDKDHPDKYKYEAKLYETEIKEVFYEKLTYIYLSMPKFNKTLDELETRFDKWLYVLKHLDTLDRIPLKIKDKIFQKLFNTAEIAKFSQEELKQYEASLKAYRDIQNSIDTAFIKGELKGHTKGKIEGKIEGKKEGKIEVAKNLLANGIDIEIIIKSTGLTKEKIEKLEE